MTESHEGILANLRMVLWPTTGMPAHSRDATLAGAHSRLLQLALLPFMGQNEFKLSWNYNYGQFQHFLRTENIEADLLNKPNMLVNRLDPPLAMLSALWFYMTPQPPKPSMHEVMEMIYLGRVIQIMQIIMGNWVPSERNHLAGYNGSVFGPTSLVINHECNGEDPRTRDTFFPGKGGENRRIKVGF